MRVLLVEDEEKIAGIVARALQAERLAVDTVRDGREGFTLAESCHDASPPTRIAGCGKRSGQNARRVGTR